MLSGLWGFPLPASPWREKRYKRMKILIVSGFLGAGKTTFIKELIRRTGQDIVILENEYGDTNIDKGELSSSGDISVLELMEGCVCCTVREGFANSVLTIASALSPAFLIVEPTGAALLSRIIDNLSRITYGDISLLPPVTLVSPRGIDHCLLYTSPSPRDRG